MRFGKNFEFLISDFVGKCWKVRVEVEGVEIGVNVD